MIRSFLAATAAAVLLGGAILGITATQTLADTEGTVASSVGAQTASVACILIVSGATPGDPMSLNFGTEVPFSQTGAPNDKFIDHTDAPTYESCSTGSQKVMSRATDMTNGSGGTWQAGTGSGCPAVNQFGMVLNLATVVGIGLSSVDTLIETGIGPGAPGAEWDYILTMPCTGSSGGGTTMSGAVVFTAVLE